MTPRAPSPGWRRGGFRSAYGRWRLHAQGTVGVGLQLVGRVWVYGGGKIHLGDRVVLDGSRGPIELHVSEGAELVIEDDVWLEGGVSLEAVESIRVGKGTFIGAWSKILDNHFHPLQGDRREVPASEPVWIGPEVHIGEHCILLPRTRLEQGVRLGAGVVIGRRVPAGLVLEGAPPRRVAP